MLRTLNALILAALLLAYSWADAGKKVVPVESLKPTQAEIGTYWAMHRLARWEEKARQHGFTVKEYAAKVLQKKHRKLKVPVVIAPNGEYRIVDRHHRVLALTTLTRETGVEFEMRLDVVADFTGQSQAVYARALASNMGVELAKGDAAAMRWLRSLPDNFDRLKDDPMRSIIGLIFNRAGIRGSRFRDYIQFHVADRLIAAGLMDTLRKEKLVGRRLPADAASDTAILEAVEKALFGNKKIVNFLKGRVAEGQGKQKRAIDNRVKAVSQRALPKDPLDSGRPPVNRIHAQRRELLNTAMGRRRSALNRRTGKKPKRGRVR